MSASQTTTVPAEITGQVLAIIIQKHNDGELLATRWVQGEIHRIKEAANNYNPTNIATGMVLTYSDGTAEVFCGDATDPYHYTDFHFVSASTHEPLYGVAYTQEQGCGEEPLEMGVRTVQEWQDMLDEQLLNAHPIFSVGDEVNVSAKLIAKVIVV